MKVDFNISSTNFNARKLIIVEEKKFPLKILKAINSSNEISNFINKESKPKNIIQKIFDFIVPEEDDELKVSFKNSSDSLLPITYFGVCFEYGKQSDLKKDKKTFELVESLPKKKANNSEKKSLIYKLAKQIRELSNLDTLLK